MVCGDRALRSSTAHQPTAIVTATPSTPARIRRLRWTRSRRSRGGRRRFGRGEVSTAGARSRARRSTAAPPCFLERRAGAGRHTRTVFALMPRSVPASSVEYPRYAVMTIASRSRVVSVRSSRVACLAPRRRRGHRRGGSGSWPCASRPRPCADVCGTGSSPFGRGSPPARPSPRRAPTAPSFRNASCMISSAS